MTRTALLAGCFDPPTLGHLDLMARAASLADQLVVAVGVHGDKQPWLPLEERLSLLRELVPAGARVISFDGLAVDAAREAGATLLVRGVRSGLEAEAEATMARANHRLAPGIETVLLVARAEVAHVSSRLVREVHASRGDLSSFVPPPVAARLRGR